jgi:hypothetical protein
MNCLHVEFVKLAALIASSAALCAWSRTGRVQAANSKQVVVR